MGKHGGSYIRELREFRHLSGKLFVLNLENVHSIEDDTKAILEDKQDLPKLELEWKLDHETKDSVNERNVL